MNPKFGVLVLNLNGREWLSALFKDLRDDGYTNKRVYLVDNGSSDGSQSMTEESFPEVIVLQMPVNMGYSMAYNVATQAALSDGCDWIVWQNNDTRVTRGWLDRLAAVAASDSRIGVMGPVFRDWSTDAPNVFMKARHGNVVPYMEDACHEPVDTDWVEGSACAVRRECFEAVGFLEPGLFIYWEEADFCRRATYHGWRVVIVPGAFVRHFGGGDTASGRVPGLDFNGLRSRNQYVFTLCDPNRSILWNALAACHLFAVNVKGVLSLGHGLGDAWSHVRVFAWFLGGLPMWVQKWWRDRHRLKPPRLTRQQAKSLADCPAGGGGWRPV